MRAQRNETLLMAATATAAAATAAGAVALGPAPDPVVLATFVALNVWAENSAVLLPSKVGVSPGLMIVMAAVTAAPPGSAVLTAAIVAASGGLVLSLARGRQWQVMVWNCSQFLLSGAAAAGAYALTATAVGFAPIVPVLAATVAFAAVNVVLVLPAMAFRGHAIGAVWGDMRPALPNFAALAAVGAVVGGLFSALGALAVVLLAVPIFVGRSTFAAFLELHQAREATIAVFLRAIRAKDEYTARHTERVARYSTLIGEEMGLPYAELERLRQAALLHDIGKLAVPKHLLQKPGRLTPEEFGQMRRHAHACVGILDHVDFLRPMTAAAAGHHARYDGGGYGDHNDELQAYIVAVADAYDAMTSTRAYRKALPQETAFAELRDKAGTQFHPACAEALIRGLTARGERHGAGHETDVVDYAVEPPTAGVGSAGLGDLEAG